MTQQPSVPTNLGIQARNVALRYGNRTVLDDLNLDLCLDGITALIGPNGAGKTSFLRLLHGMMVPGQGSVVWQRNAAAAVRPETAFLLQHPVMLRRSVRSNIRFALTLTGRKVPSADEEDRLLALGGLTDRADRPARRLSGGEQQRLALVREVARTPAVLLLDEPASGLDPAATARLEALIRNLAGQGTAILFSSHDMGQVRRLADRFIFIDRGRNVDQGTLPDGFDNPNTAQLKAFLGGDLTW